MKRRVFVAGVTGGLGLFGGCLSSIQVDDGTESRATRTEQQTHDVGSDTSLRVHNPNGAVTVTGYDGETATIDIEIRGPTERSVEAVSVSADRSEGYLTVVTEYDDSEVDRADVSLTIKYPNGSPVERLKTNNGSIELRDTTGDTALTSKNGSLSVRNADGTVALSTGNGSITARNIGGLEEATASNGSIEIDVPAISGDVTVGTANGGIDAALSQDLDATITASTSHSPVELHGIELADTGDSTNVSGTLGEGTHTLTVETNNGSIDLRLLSA